MSSLTGLGPALRGLGGGGVRGRLGSGGLPRGLRRGRLAHEEEGMEG